MFTETSGKINQIFKEFFMKKTIFVLLTVLALGFLFISCSSNDDGGDNPFVGTWTGTYGSSSSMKLVCTSKT
jgi:hypothetical protein